MTRPAWRSDDDAAAQPSLLVTVAIFALAFLVPAWPWLSGAVTMPYDAKSTFLPPVEFMARAFATGESPFWTPNVFAGWPNVADPQSMLHLAAACAARAGERGAGLPGDRRASPSRICSSAGSAIILYFRDRGWHAAGALVAALAFAFGGAASARLQHTGQVISLAWLPIALWLLSRALDRSSWRYGALAGIGGRPDRARARPGRAARGLCARRLRAGALARRRAGVARAARERHAADRRRHRRRCSSSRCRCCSPSCWRCDSNRPEFSFIEAGRGSLHWTHLLSLVFPDLFGAMDPKVDFWGAGGFAWNERFGMADLFLAQNMGLLYSGALVPDRCWSSASRAAGCGRARSASSPSRRVLIAFYMFGWYTPVFRAMYEVMPGVKLFRRPADATFVFGALIAIMAGYLVHRWLDRADPRRGGSASSGSAHRGLRSSPSRSGSPRRPSASTPAWKPIVAGLCFVAGRRRDPALGAAPDAPLGRDAACSRRSPPPTSPGTTRRTSRPACRPRVYDALRPDTQNETVALIKQRLATQQPNHRDRVELIGIGYHWPNICMIHGCEHVFGHNPLRLKWFYEATKVGDTVAAPGQRPFSPLYPSYRSTFADLFGLRLIATGVPVEQIDKTLKPGDLNFVARTKDAYVYENPRALPRVMLIGDWQVVDFDKLIANGWPAECRSGQDRAAGKGAARRTAHHVRGGRHRAARALRQHGGRWSRSIRRRAACWCSTTSGIRGGARRSTASRPRSCAPT